MVDGYGWTFVFPSFVLQPGATVRAATGCGTSGPDILYWCHDGATALWNNDGDTVHLHDATGSMLVSFGYCPKAYRCAIDIHRRTAWYEVA